MYNIAKLSPASQEFVSNLTLGNKSRTPSAALALAKVIIDKECLPSAPVEDPVTYYRTQVKIAVDQKISQLNELTILDTKLVSEYCANFFQYRYMVLHAPKLVYLVGDETQLEDFFSISRVFDKATLTIIKTESRQMSVYMNGFGKVLEELKGA